MLMAAGIRTVPAEDWPERVDGQLIVSYQMGLSSPEATFQHHHAAESVAFEGSFDTTLPIRKQ